MKPAQLVGVWQLREFVLQADGAESRPFGERPNGRLHVSENGELLVAIFAEQRARLASDDLQAGLPHEAAAVLRSSLCYFGRWQLDAETATLRTEVHGALFPNLEATIQERTAELKGPDELILSTKPLAWEGRSQSGVLRWTRVP